MVYVLIDYILLFFFFFKQKTAYEMRISDWSSDVCFFRADSGMVYPSVKKGGVYETIVSFKQVKKQAYPLEISMKTGPASSEPMLEVHNTTAEDYRSEEHTSELQSLMRTSYAVFCLKKKTPQIQLHQHDI